MNPKHYERLMRTHEIFSQLRVPPGMWTVLRLDGRAFHMLTQGLRKPFDVLFHERMQMAARTVFRELQPVYAYIQSDEMSFAFMPSFDLFDRRVEKLVSVAASLASANFSCSGGREAAFDARVWVGADEVDVVDYFSWRLADCERNCLNGLAQNILYAEGISPRETHARLLRVKRDELHEMIHKRGIDFAKLPPAQRNGSEIILNFVIQEHARTDTGMPIHRENTHHLEERDVEIHGQKYRENLVMTLRMLPRFLKESTFQPLPPAVL